MKNDGQALIILLVVIPLLLLIFGLIARSGGAALAHDRIENHCNKKILDTLEVQGRALTKLGHINPFARTVITTRRSIDPLVEAGVVYLVPLQQALRAAQLYISQTQKIIEKKALIESKIILASPAPRNFLGKLRETYKPDLPSLHVEPEKLYQNENGPPLQLDKDFQNKQTASGSIRIFTEKFLSFWPNFENPLAVGRNLKASDMKLNCKAKIQMDQLEGKWTAQIVEVTARP